MLGAVIVLAVLAAAGVFLAVRSARSAELARTALTRARAGLARDTAGSLREAATLLAEARGQKPDDPGLASLQAQVAGLLASDHGNPSAATLARELVEAGTAGEGGVAARLLVAPPGSPERKAAEAAVLDARPSGPPLLTTLAGELLVARGEVDAGRGRLGIAARSSPPMLRALAALGDSALAAGDAEGALDFYAPALAAHRTHPRSVVGAAEARLALGRDLVRAREDLEALEADPASPPPASLKLRFATAFAKVLAGLGDVAGAVTRLKTATQALGDSAPLAAALAEVQLSARAWDGAEAAALRAVALAPKDLGPRVLLARALTGRGKPQDALKALGGREERAARVQRALALERMGRFAEARAELEKTVRDGRMPSDAAVLYALADVALGRADRARPLLERLAGAAAPPPLAAVALGKACEALADAACAEKAYRDAVAREPRAPEGHAALGRLLAARGDGAAAVAALSEAVKLDPSDLDARRDLGQARLLGGQPAAARADLDAVLLAQPKDAAALTLVSAAWLAEGEATEARRAADRAVAAAPKDPGALLAGARAALAAGDPAGARGLALRAQRAGAKAEDVQKVLAEAGGAPKAAGKAPAPVKAAAKPAARKKK
ncbi:MAG: tetratricopeptide repeat protein [Anaeromyxobacteraceae bacterium]